MGCSARDCRSCSGAKKTPAAFSLPGRQAWVGFLLQEGKKEDARREFDLIRRLRPPDLAEREKWFAEQVRE
jgi:hypothetical protein